MSGLSGRVERDNIEMETKNIAEKMRSRTLRIENKLKTRRENNVEVI